MYLQFVPREFFHVSTTAAMFSIPSLWVEVSKQLLLNHICCYKKKQKIKGINDKDLFKIPYYMKFWRHFNLANLAIFLKITKLKCTKIKCC